MTFFLKDKEDGRRLSEFVLQAVQDTAQEFVEIEGASDGAMAEDVGWNHGGAKHQRVLERLRMTLRKSGPKWKAIDDLLPMSRDVVTELPIAILFVTMIDLGVDALEQKHRRRKREILAAQAKPR